MIAGLTGVGLLMLMAWWYFIMRERPRAVEAVARPKPLADVASSDGGIVARNRSRRQASAGPNVPAKITLSPGSSACPGLLFNSPGRYSSNLSPIPLYVVCRSPFLI